jgi:hypothetical protein
MAGLGHPGDAAAASRRETGVSILSGETRRVKKPARFGVSAFIVIPGVARGSTWMAGTRPG